MPADKMSRKEMSAARLERLLRRERALWTEGASLIAGVDEAGVGPLAGPVVAAAVIFEPGAGIEGVNDSKKVSPARRMELACKVREMAVAFAVERLEPEEIDRMNIYQATLEAMRRAVMGLGIEPDHVLVDARTIPRLPFPQEAIIKGDTKSHTIAAASILAKTARDEMMERFDTRYPGYGFASHKGYPTEGHRDAIRRLGPCPIHRRSFTLLPGRRLWD